MKFKNMNLKDKAYYIFGEKHPSGYTFVLLDYCKQLVLCDRLCEMG